MTFTPIQTALSPDCKRRHYYTLYTIAFLILAFFCFSWFLFSGKSFIWQTDGWQQHFKSLVYYAQYLRKIIKHLLLEHKLIIPDWDFYIGEGSDIVNALHYYVIGDPIALFSVFVPTRYMHLFYSFSCVFRIYLAGIAFSELCFGTGRYNRRAILSGSLSYAFSYWGILNVTRHPYFLNPMIYFPLMVLGVEKLIKKERPYLFIITTAIAAASNFYFFYMIVILTIVYAVVRLILLYRRNVKQIVLLLLKAAATALIGVCIAGVLLLPVLTMFLNDSRLGVSQPFHLFYPLSYYSKLPAILIQVDSLYWLCLGVSAPIVLSAVLLFLKKKEALLLKALFLICVLITAFPICGRLLNGMSYMTNRWSWAFVLLLCYILVNKWDELFSLSETEWKRLLVFSVGYYLIILFFEKSRSAAALSVIPLFFITCLILKTATEKTTGKFSRQALIVVIIGISLVNSAFWKFSPGAGNYVAQFKENSKIWSEEWNNNETQIIKSYANEAYPRYTGSVTPNVNMVNHISNTGYFFSISIPSINAYRDDLRMREDLFQQYTGYDDRTSAIGLASVGYYVKKPTDSAAVLPYGYELLGTKNAAKKVQEQISQELIQELGGTELTEEQAGKISKTLENKYAVYRNLYSLPLGYCYQSYVTEDAWASLDPVQRQEIQLYSATIDVPVDGFTEVTAEMPDYEIAYKAKCLSPEITQTNGGFTATANNTKVRLELAEEVKDAELYISFEGIGYVPSKEYDLYFGAETVDPLNLYNKANWKLLSHDTQLNIRKDKIFWDPVKNATFSLESSDGVKKQITYRPPDASFSSGRKDFIANLGYSAEARSSVTITFPTRGIYSFSGIKIYAVPMEGYSEKINELKKDSLQNITLGVDNISGDIALDENKILCVATPYSSGWKAYVDGKEQRVLCVNRHYLGLALSKGYHTISFQYSTPYKHVGFVLSLLGIVAFVLLLIIYERNRAARKTGHTKGHREPARARSCR